MVPDVFGSFMLNCFIEPDWIPFLDFQPACWNKSFLEQKCILDGSQCFWLLCVSDQGTFTPIGAQGGFLGTQP